MPARSFVDRRMYGDAGWSELELFAEPERSPFVVWTLKSDHVSTPVQHEMTADDARAVRDALDAWLQTQPGPAGHDSPISRRWWSGVIAILDTPSETPGSLIGMICSQADASPHAALPLPLTRDATNSQPEHIGSVEEVWIHGNQVRAFGWIDTDQPAGERLHVAVALSEPVGFETDADGRMRVTSWTIDHVGLTGHPSFPQAVITLGECQQSLSADR